jgi:predicted transcriptional regulator
VPAVIANCADERGLPVAGLRFEIPDDIRAEVREVVERVDRSRRRVAVTAAPAKTKRRKRDKGGVL